MVRTHTENYICLKTTPQPTKYGTAIVLTLVGKDVVEKTLFVPYSERVTDQTNLGRLIAAFGNDTDEWVGKRINVTIENNQRTIEPSSFVAKVSVCAHHETYTLRASLLGGVACRELYTIDSVSPNML